LDVDGLYPVDAPEMTEIILSTGHVELISNVTDNPDTEPAQIIDLGDSEDADEAEPVTEPVAEVVEPVTEPAEEAEDDEPNEDVAESYSEMPHFPIALIVNEI
jgi:hypothetical protein